MKPHLCQIITFPARGRTSQTAKPDSATMEALTEAARLTDLVSQDIEAATLVVENIGCINPQAGVASGRTLTFAIRAVLQLMQLRHHPADRPLQLAIEEWLYQRGNGNG